MSPLLATNNTGMEVSLKYFYIGRKKKKQHKDLLIYNDLVRKDDENTTRVYTSYFL